MGARGPAHDRQVVGGRLRALRSRSVAARQRRCHGCTASWPRRSRFCGTCGLPLDTVAGLETGADDPASTTARDPQRHVTFAATGSRPRHRRHLTLPISAAAAVVVVWLLVSDHLDVIGVSDPTESAVDIRLADDEPPPGAEPLVTCQRGGDVAATCGPVLVDGRRSRVVVSPLSSDAVVLGASGEVTRVDLPSGAVRWRTLAFTGGRQLLLHGDSERVLATSVAAVATIDAQTGDLLWRRQLYSTAGSVDLGERAASDHLPNADVTAPTGIRAPARAWWVGDDVLVLDHLGVLHALDGDTGVRLWRHSEVGNQAIETPDGVVTVRWDLIAAWRPEVPAPIWKHVDQGLRPSTVVQYGTTVGGPLPLSPWRRLIDSATGELIELPRGGPTITYVSDEVTLMLQWPDGDVGLEVTAWDAGANERWRRTGLPIPCCITSAVRATDGRLALTSPSVPDVLLDLRDGATLATLERASGRLEAVVGELALWRTSDGLVAEDVGGGSEAFRALGTLLSLEPLLIDGPSGLVAVATTATPALVPSSGIATR